VDRDVEDAKGKGIEPLDLLLRPERKGDQGAKELIRSVAPRSEGASEGDLAQEDEVVLLKPGVEGQPVGDEAEKNERE
jgi:hypothetical protein